MNKNYLALGKELVSEVSKTWGNLGYLHIDFIKEDTLEEIGRQTFQNKEVFNDYLEYKYQLEDYYAENSLKLNNPWIAEWWYDSRGCDYQKETFHELANIIIDLIVETSGWRYDEDVDFYLPQGYQYDDKLSTIVLECNHNVSVDLKYAQC